MAELDYPWDDPPEPGTTREIVPGIRWLTMPLGGSLAYINLYLVEDHDGWLVIDTGLGNDTTRELWERIATRELDKPITGVLCTHMHPDHTGCAAFLTDRFQARFHMSRTEYYQSRAFSSSGGSHHTSWLGERFYRAAGMPQEFVDQLGQMWAERAKASDGFSMPTMPAGYFRLEHGDTLKIGDHDWTVLVGSGHSPEHVCLLCPRLQILLSGDQILPIITSNVSVHPTEPEANPLKDWLDSHDRFLDQVPPDVLVLPAHNLPFRGVRTRLAQLIAHHEDRMLAIEEACEDQPLTAREMLPVLFNRKLDSRQMMMALGEAIAHVRLLEHRNRLERIDQDDGTQGFRSIDPTLVQRRHPAAHDAPDAEPQMV